MSKSSTITINSAELRDRTEEHLGRWIPDKLWDRAEPYARRKLELARQREPDVTYYDNDYLVLLTADTVRETEFADCVNAISAARMEAARV